MPGFRVFSADIDVLGGADVGDAVMNAAFYRA
jgi:hypothetical protein